MWLSLVERYVRDVEVAGSNPVTSTTVQPPENGGLEPFSGGFSFAFLVFWSLFGLYGYKNRGFPVVEGPFSLCLFQENIVQRLSGCRLCVLDGLSVNIQCGACLAMPKPCRHGSHVHAAGN